MVVLCCMQSASNVRLTSTQNQAQLLKVGPNTVQTHVLQKAENADSLFPVIDVKHLHGKLRKIFAFRSQGCCSAVRHAQWHGRTRQLLQGRIIPFGKVVTLNIESVLRSIVKLLNVTLADYKIKEFWWLTIWTIIEKIAGSRT